MTSNQREDLELFWAPAAGAIVVFLIIVSLALIAVGGWRDFYGFITGQAAGWAQALGGGLAVLAAFRLGRIQIDADRRRDARSRVEHDLHRLHVISAVFAHTFAITETFRREWEKAGRTMTSEAAREYWEEAKSNFTKIDVFECPDPVLVVHILHTPRHLSDLLATYDNYCTFVSTPQQTAAVRDLSDALAETIQHLNDSVDGCNAAVIRRVHGLHIEDQAQIRDTYRAQTAAIKQREANMSRRD